MKIHIDTILQKGKRKMGRLLSQMTAFLFLAVLFCSCEDVIEVKLPSEDLNLIGVEAEITSVDQPYVFLYKTLKVNQDQAYPGITGAVVSISDNQIPAKKVTLTEDPMIKGFYKVAKNISYRGVPGREYTLTILTGGVTLTAKETLFPVAKIDSIQVKPSTRGNKIFLGVFTYGLETPGRGNYYKWDVFVNDSLIRSADRIAIASDEYVDGNYVSGLEVYTDFHDPNKPKDRMLNLNDTISVRQNSISQFAYNFYFQVINQASTGSLFSVPPANVKGNFTSSDGKPVLGIFLASDVSIPKKVVITQAIEDQLTKP